MKPKIYFKNGYWRVSSRPPRISGKNWEWGKAHDWVNNHNNYSTPELRRQSPWGTKLTPYDGHPYVTQLDYRSRHV